ncbi:MAG: DJ-1/PfpI family protein [Bacteroidales bacterium]
MVVKNQKQEKPGKRVLLFLGLGFEAFEAGAFTDVFGWSREAGSQPADMFTTALHPEIRCTWNLIVRPELIFDQVRVEDFDALAIPGGFESAGFQQDTADERVQQLIRDFHRQKKPIAAICVAAIPLAKSGILSGRSATTYDLDDGKWRRQLHQAGAHVQDEIMVRDEHIITSMGPSSSLPVAFTLLTMLTSPENTQMVKKMMREDHL